MMDKILIYLFFIFVFFLHFSAVPGLINAVPTVLLLFVLIFWSGLFIRNRKSGYQKTGLEKPLLFLVLANLFSVFDAYIKLWSLGKTISLFLLFGLLLIFTSIIKQKEQYQKLLAVVFWGGIIFLLSGLYQYIVSVLGPQYHIDAHLPSFLKIITTEARGLPRISSLFLQRSGTNVYSCYLALYAPFLLVYPFVRYSNKLVGAIVSLLVLVNVFLTTSRALFISLIFLLVFMFLKTSYKKVAVPLTIFFILCCAVFFIKPVNKTVVSLFDKTDISNIEHLQTFFYAVDNIKRHPINGWGADHVSRRIRKTADGWQDAHDYKMRIAIEEWTPEKFYEVKEKARKDGVLSIDSPHNIYLWQFLDLGIIGLAAFVYLLSVVFGKLLKLAGHGLKNHLLAVSFLYGYVAFLIYNFFQDSLNAPIMVSFFIIFILLVVCLEKFNKEKIL